MTVRESVDAAAGVLTRAGFSVDDARRDAAVLARHLLGWSLAEWALRAGRQAPHGFGERLTGLARRRAAHEPVAYLTGSREFYGRDFCVSRAVLIPRPETEGVVDEALRVLRGTDFKGVRPVVADVGTGSGCIAITLALEWPAARVLATDTSPGALDVARENALRLGAPVEFFRTAPPAFLPSDTSEVDLIVSNPPYVAESDRATLPPDVRDFEPAEALFAGEDGLSVIRALVRAAARNLARGGTLIMEIGPSQAGEVRRLLAAAGFDDVSVQPDLQGLPRIAVARRPAS